MKIFRVWCGIFVRTSARGNFRCGHFVCTGIFCVTISTITSNGSRYFAVIIYCKRFIFCTVSFLLILCSVYYSTYAYQIKFRDIVNCNIKLCKRHSARVTCKSLNFFRKNCWTRMFLLIFLWKTLNRSSSTLYLLR